ncbi:MAG: heparinase II/III family protein, partial [Planctomycetota bacterium]
DDLRKSAEKMIGEPTVVHKLIGPRLLSQSRRCLHRVYTLAAIYRLDGDRRFAQRAEKELLAATNFPDWNPSHFLDTAEMTHALGIGYDWLYDYLSPPSRSTIRTAIIEKGLKPAEQIYRQQKWWVKARHNWNQVCNGGITVGALAIADTERELASYIIEQAVESIRRPTAELAPDGGWAEGSGYWNYAMSYTAYYLAAMQTALGTDFNLHQSPGMAETGLFRIHFIGPTGLAFNYADAGYTAGPGNAPQMFFFARLFDRPVYAWHQRQYRYGSYPLDLLWYDPRGTDADANRLPLDAYFKNVDVVFLRSKWNDPNALFVGFKGGDNQASHSHLDLGTFVFDALGQRWAIDLGADEYNLPHYFGKNRWTYYRLRTEGQNSLLINGQNQEPKAKAPIIAFESTPTKSFAVADLSAAYVKFARRVHRGIVMIDKERVLIQDEIEADKSLDVEWNMHTTAEVKIAGNTALLTLDKQKLRVRALALVDGEWHVQPIDLKPPRRPTKNTRKLIFRFQTKPPFTQVAVLLSPYTGPTDDRGVIPLKALKDWSSAGRRQ